MESNFKEKIKISWEDNQRDILLIGGIILIALISFGAGYLISQKQTPPLVIEEPKEGSILGAATSTFLLEQTASAFAKGLLVASKNGKYYHWPWSSWAKNIKPENQAWFNSEGEAQKAGFKPASNFKELAPPGYQTFQ